MQYVNLVVRPGKRAKCDGKTYLETQTFRATPRQARRLMALGRVQVDHAGESGAHQQDRPPSPEGLSAVREQNPERESTPGDGRTDTSADQPAAPASEKDHRDAPATPAPRRRNYRRRDMTAEQD